VKPSPPAVQYVQSSVVPVVSYSWTVGVGHPAPELPVHRLVDREADRRDTRRTQHQVGVRVVGDEVGDLPRGDQVAHRLDLGLGRRTLAAVRVVQRITARAGTAPEARVVAVEVHADVARQRGAVDGRQVAGSRTAVLAAVLQVDRAVALVLGDALCLARDVEPIRIHDRDDDRPRLVDQPRRQRVVPVAPQQVVGELERMLARRPLTSVMDADVQEGRLAVLCERILRDLDADDVAALDALVRQRDRLHQRRIAHREPLQLRLEVRKPPVGRAAARQRRAVESLRVGLVRAAVPAVQRLDIGDLHVVGHPGRAQRRLVAGAVQRDVHAAGADVLGDVKAGVL
jgi:hypothetical protein